MPREPDPLPMFLQASLVPLPTREAKGSQMSIAGCFTYLSFYFWMTIKISSQWKSCCSVLDAVIFPCAFQMQTQVIYSVYRCLHSSPCRLNLASNPQLFPCSSVRTLRNQWQAGGASQLTLNVWGSLVSAWASILCVRQVPYLWSSSCFSVLYWEPSCSNARGGGFLPWCGVCHVEFLPICARQCQPIPRRPQGDSPLTESVFALVNGFVLTSAVHKAQPFDLVK